MDAILTGRLRLGTRLGSKTLGEFIQTRPSSGRLAPLANFSPS